MMRLKHVMLAAVAALSVACTATQAAAEIKNIVVAEPLHAIGYLPLYVAMEKGFFREEGLNVTLMTIESGSGHTNAVLSKQAFAFIGGPEHDAFAKLKGAELRAVVNVVDRGNVYYIAKSGDAPAGNDFASFLKGKAIATGYYGGTPNSITRYLLKKWGLDAQKDVTVREMTSGGILAALRTGNADIGSINEPLLTQGIRKGFWGKPILNIPQMLGPYAYSTLNVREESIKNEPDVVQKFVRGVSRGLKATYANPQEAAEIAKKQFPTMALDDLKATLDRSFADQIWSRDGRISEAAWTTAKAVVMDAGILKKDVPYDDIIDMQFMDAMKTSAK
jgi:NitT/TauT family transport system substrate-binding protein